jgi:hypothetical protein
MRVSISIISIDKLFRIGIDTTGAQQFPKTGTNNFHLLIDMYVAGHRDYRPTEVSYEIYCLRKPVDSTK